MPNLYVIRSYLFIFILLNILGTKWKTIRSRIPWILMIAAISIAGCKPLNQKEFTNWIHEYDNGFHVAKVVDEFVFDIQYEPDIVQGPTSGKKIILKIGLLNEADLLQHQITSNEDWQKRNYYFSFLFQNDIHIEVVGKKIPCSLFHFEKSVDKKNQRTFHLLFDDTSVDRDFYLVIDSPVLYSFPIRIKLRNSDLPKVATT